MTATTDQPGKSPEVAPQSPEVKSDQEKARLELEAKQKAETAQVGAEHAKQQTETLNASANAKAEILTATLENNQATHAQPAAAPAEDPLSSPNAPSATSKGFSQFKEYLDKFKEIFKLFGAKVSEFFSKIFGKKPEQATSTPTNTPAPAPGATPAAGPAPNAPAKSAEVDKNSWRGLVESEAKRLGIDPAFALAIITVESGKSPFSNANNPLEGLGNPPIIRFEPHVLNSQLSARGINEKHGGWGSSKLVGRNVDGVSCEGGQANEIACLRKAMEINREAAFNSISMGMGQIMGFNAKGTGYSSAEEMFRQFSSGGGGVNAQILGMFKLIENNKAHLQAARNKDFSKFSSLYNGASVGSSKHASYMAALQNAYRSNGGTTGGNTAVA